MNVEIDNLIVSFTADYNTLFAELNEYVGNQPKKPRGRPIIYLTLEDRKIAYREKYKARLHKNSNYL